MNQDYQSFSWFKSRANCCMLDRSIHYSTTLKIFNHYSHSHSLLSLKGKIQKIKIIVDNILHSLFNSLYISHMHIYIDREKERERERAPCMSVCFKLLYIFLKRMLKLLSPYKYSIESFHSLYTMHLWYVQLFKSKYLCGSVTFLICTFSSTWWPKGVFINVCNIQFLIR